MSNPIPKRKLKGEARARRKARLSARTKRPFKDPVLMIEKPKHKSGKRISIMDLLFMDIGDVLKMVFKPIYRQKFVRKEQPSIKQLPSKKINNVNKSKKLLMKRQKR